MRVAMRCDGATPLHSLQQSQRLQFYPRPNASALKSLAWGCIVTQHATAGYCGSMKVKSLPPILALHLKRFKFIESLQRFKKLSYAPPLQPSPLPPSHALHPAAVGPRWHHCRVPLVLSRRLPPMRQPCTSPAPALHQPCSCTAPALHQHCSSTAAALHQHCASTAPALHQLGFARLSPVGHR